MRFTTQRFLATTLGTAVLLVAGAGPALAVPPGDDQVQTLAAAGSDTTQDLMAAVLASYRGAANPDGDVAVNIPVRPADPVVVPADSSCAERTYVPSGQDAPPATYPAPNGSGAGKTALANAANLGTACIDIARSSSGRAASDPATFEYYGYAKDAVSWAHFPGAAPDDLTVEQLREIYACTVTNWSQVGGQDAPIVRYLPPAGSGTRSFFVGTVLGAEPSAECGPVKVAAENDGTAVAAEDRTAAILPYSVAQWVSQANGAGIDVRAGILVGALAGQSPVAGPGTDGRYEPNAAVVNGGFPGVRTVFNILDTRLSSYPQALRIVGFDASGPGLLCSGAAAQTLKTYGFTPLPADGTGNACVRA